MKKLYKLALGAGATAAVAIPAVAVVSCGKVNNHKDASQANSKNNQNSGSNGGSASVVSSTKPGVEIDYKSITANGQTVSVEEVTKASQSDLLKKLKELKIADEKDTDEQFDSNLESYTVKLVDVLASNEEALSTKDTKDLLVSIIAHYQDKISLQTKHDLIVMSDFVAEYVHNNHLITKAAEALNYNPKKGDTDFLEKFDAGHADLLKVVSFAGNALEAFPHNIGSSSTQAILDLITSVEMPQMIKDLFPTNNDAAMKAWAEVLNSGIIQEIGSLINEAFSQGIGNVDFDALKASVATLISKAENALVAADVSIMSLEPAFLNSQIDALNIPGLIDVIKDIMTEGVFGINKDLVDVVNKISNSPILPLLSLEVPELEKYMPLIKSAVAVVNQLDSGIANVKQEDFEAEINAILSKIPGVPANMESLVSKLLYGFKTEKEFIDLVDSFVPDSVLELDPGYSIGKVRDLINGALINIYRGTTWDVRGLQSLLLRGVVMKDQTAPISALLKNGLLNVSKDDMLKALPAIKVLAGRIVNALESASGFSDDLKKLMPTVQSYVGIVQKISDSTLTETGNAIYSLTHNGIEASAADVRKTGADIIDYIKTIKFLDVPKFVFPLIKVALNGFDSLDVADAEIIEQWVETLISSDTPYVHSQEFKNGVLSVLIGREKLDEFVYARDHTKDIAAAKEAIRLDNQKALDAFVATQHNIASVADELKAHYADAVKATDIHFNQPDNGFHLAIKHLNVVNGDLTITFTFSSDSEGVVARDVTETITGFAKKANTVNALIQHLIDKGFGTVTSTNFKQVRVELTKYLVSIGMPEAKAKTYESLVSQWVGGLIVGDLHTILNSNYPSFAAWWNAKVHAVTAGTMTSQAIEFTKAMDALNA